jgi:hypothetical protein
VPEHPIGTFTEPVAQGFIDSADRCGLQLVLR